jgi:hypothetical protein
MTTTTIETVSVPCVDERRELRGLAGWINGRLPVVVIDGLSAPRQRGDHYHYETRGGERISHPSAYSKRGWSNMIYCCSTIRVEVGRDWLVAWRQAGGVFAPTAAAERIAA